MQINSIKQRGFTLIELLVVAPLVILLIGVMIGYISAVTGDGLKAQQQNSLAYEAQNALDDIDTTTARAVSFKDKTANIISPQGKNDTATDFTSNDDFLVLESIALTGNGSDDTRAPVYSELGNGECNTSSAPYTYYTVYFVSSNTLYKRTILPNTPKCGTPQQKSSCSPTIMQGTPPGACQVEDEKLTDNVTSFKISYLNDANQITSFSLATTVSIKLTTQKNVAGSALNYTATLRSKKQNSAQPLASQTPSVQGNNLTNPDTFYCTWDQLPNASNYSFQYRFNAESWTTSTEALGTGSKTIDASLRRGQKLECQVTANLTAGGTVAYTSFVVNSIPLWTDPTLENNWVRYDNYYAGAGYTKTASGMIVLKGLIRAGTAPARAFQLPTGYRPQNSLLFQQSAAAASGPSAAGRIDVTADGSVIVQGSANGWASLSGINFMPSQNQSSFTVPTFNGWSNYSPSSGDPNWLGAGYMQDSAGRTRTQGLIRGGTSTDATLAFTVPSNLRPAEYEHVAAHNSGSFGVIGNVPSNGINVKGGGNGYVETNTLTYPSTFSGWTNLSLVNPWVRYPGFTTPKFTKGSDGLVMLKGFVQSGSAGSYILNIPGNLGLCPKERHLYAVGAYGAYGRVDVEPGTVSGGCGVSFQAGNSGWVSLDAITWIAEI